MIIIIHVEGISNLYLHLNLLGSLAGYLIHIQTAGVGGGPLVNICLMICMGYDAKLSISVTYIFLIGGSLASIWRNSQKINVKTGKTDVNLELIILTLPSMVTGALFGVFPLIFRE